MNGSRDYLLEVIERAGEALAAMATGRTDLRAREEETDVELAFDREFGHLHLHLARVDATSAALLLRPPRRVRLYALMLVRLAATRDEAGAEALVRRALELLLAADAVDPGGREPALLAMLAASVDHTRLEPFARAALAPVSGGM
ncbi:MAG TPA: hypothetical protein VGB85_07570 [Nannocystis sp.]|jgi:hypothetical protein